MADQDAALFAPELTFLDVELGSKEELFDMLGECLVERGLVEPTWREAIQEREDRYPTGLGFPALDVAIPHVDPAHIRTPYIALVRPRDPIPFEGMGGIEGTVHARLVVNLGIMRDGGQVAMLQGLMNMLMDPDRDAEVLAQTTPEALVSTFVRGLAEISGQ